MPPSTPSAFSVTVHVTFGTFFGMRPMTSRSKSSAISGRRFSHHCFGVVTFLPFFSVRTSGIFGNGFASDSSKFAWFGADSLPLGPGRSALMPSWPIMFL